MHREPLPVPAQTTPDGTGVAGLPAAQRQRKTLLVIPRRSIPIWGALAALLAGAAAWWATSAPTVPGLTLNIAPLLIRPGEVSSRIAHATVLEVADDTLGALLKHRHMFIGGVA